MKSVNNFEEILFVYKDFLGKGGFPSEIRELVTHLPKYTRVTVICEVGDFKYLKKGISYIYINSLKDIFNLKSNIQFHQIVFCGFSSLYNICISLKIKQNYVVLPFSQINVFLDFDNPFEKNALPIVKTLELEKKSSHKNVQGRVKNGKRDIHSAIRALKRKFFRETIGKYFLNNADGIGIISQYEEDEINKIYFQNKYKFFNYRFGSILDLNKKGNDKLEQNTNLIKLVVWSRVDFYYKGIDKLLNAIANISDTLKVKLYIVGPDYNKGYEKVIEFIKKNNIENHVQLLKTGEYTSGTFGILADADIVACLSRWDGYPRVLRESLLLNIPILISKEANFDIPIKKFNCGVIVDTNDQIENILSTLDRKYLNSLKENSLLNDYFSWEACSSDFIKSLMKVTSSAKN